MSLPQRTRMMSRPAALALVLALPFALAACGGGDGGDGPDPGKAAADERAHGDDGDAAADYDPVAESMPVEISMPDLGITQVVDDDLCRMTAQGIDPVGMMDVCFYTAADRPFVLPSTDQEDVAVMAGHAGSYTPGIFDDVYDAENDTFAVDEGDELRVRTEASGDKWLVYKAADFHTPSKRDLAVDDDIWGTEPTPGRLLLLTCLQPADFSLPALDNAVVGYQFSHVADDDGM